MLGAARIGVLVLQCAPSSSTSRARALARRTKAVRRADGASARPFERLCLRLARALHISTRPTGPSILGRRDCRFASAPKPNLRL